LQRSIFCQSARSRRSSSPLFSRAMYLGMYVFSIWLLALFRLVVVFDNPCKLQPPSVIAPAVRRLFLINFRRDDSWHVSSQSLIGSFIVLQCKGFCRAKIVIFVYFPSYFKHFPPPFFQKHHSTIPFFHSSCHSTTAHYANDELKVSTNI